MADNTRSPEEIARLNARMAEIDRYLKDPKMKLGRGASGKFQFSSDDEPKSVAKKAPKKTSKFTSSPGSGPRTGGASINPPVYARAFDAPKYSTPADTAKFRAKRDAPEGRYGVGSLEDEITGVAGMKRGGKVATVMHEFKSGKLKSSSGQKVSNPKQAIAIAMSEAGMKKAKKFAGKSGSYVGGSKRFEDLNKEMNRTGARYDLDDSSESTLKAIKDESMKDATKRQSSPKKQSFETMRSRASRTVAPVVPGMKKGGEVGESKKMAQKEMAFMKRKGAPKSMIKHEEKEAKGMKSGGSCYAKGGIVQRFARGGKVRGYADGGMMGRMLSDKADPRAMAMAVNPRNRPQGTSPAPKMGGGVGYGSGAMTPEIAKTMQKIQSQGAKLAGAVDKAGGLQAMLGQLGGAGVPKVGPGMAGAYGGTQPPGTLGPLAGRGGAPQGVVDAALAGVPKVNVPKVGVPKAGPRPPMPQRPTPPPPPPIYDPPRPFDPTTLAADAALAGVPKVGPGLAGAYGAGQTAPSLGDIGQSMAAAYGAGRPPGFKKGGKVAAKMPKAGGMKKFAKGGRVDGCATRGKTNCKMR